MRKSLVVGVHDGLNLLPYSLANIKTLPINESIFVLDQCIPQQKYVKLIKRFVPDASILIKHFRRWRYHPAETFQYGLSRANGDLLYVSAEDVILDPQNFNESYWSNPDVGMVDFRYYQHDPDKFNFHVAWDLLLMKVSDKFGYGSVRSGLYGIRKTVFEEVGGLKDCATEEDWLRKDVANLGYQHVHVKSTWNLHLRPSYDKQRQLLQGVSRKQQGFTFTRTLGHSLLHFKPYVLKGYLQCQCGSMA